MAKQTIIGVNLKIEGLHNWDTIDESKFREVDYLKYPHRHNFHIACKKVVSHNDRDTEIIMFKHKILKYLRDKYWNQQKYLHMFRRNYSCEMLANELYDHFDLYYCSVYEDGEFGAEVITQPENNECPCK